MDDLIDTHCHWQDPRLESRCSEWWPQIEIRGWSGMVNGTEPDDWERVAAWAEKSPLAKPSFGIHPWQVTKARGDWRERLRSYLERFPGAGVGEIGIDKWIRDADLPRQKEIFREQWKLAVELNRPITVHCLQAFGHLLEELGGLAQPPGGFLLHAYGGPEELVEPFLGFGAHFSFNGYFLQERKAAVREIFRKLPEDRLLVETDAPHMLPPEPFRDEVFPEEHAGENALHHPANLSAAVRGLAGIRGWTLGETASTTTANARRLFALSG
ncbi:MAG: TatD family hydrolase [Opitutales bacterium]|nr:TatD family hydrolase [Opitutales bacterium]MCH8541899.1 TatD family hydrolase [Opitutales bacterium]